jgi:hypothetical protein
MPTSLSSLFHRNQYAQLHDRLTLLESIIEHLIAGGELGGASGPFTDPGPEDFGRARLAGVFGGRRPPIGDPAVFDLARLRDLATQPEFANMKVADLLRRIRPQPGDPVPEDIHRFNIAELEEQIHRLAAQRIRLDSMEKMLNERLAELKKSTKG